MRPFRNSAALLAAAAACWLSWPAAPGASEIRALPPLVGTSERIVADWRTGFALDGADPVAYFAEGATRQGRDGLEAVWRGVAWRFASEANRRAFVRDPDAYAPRLGGYDAVMAARGVAVAGDPTHFVVASGRLYLFRSAANRDAFRADPDLASRAERAWPALGELLTRD